MPEMPTNATEKEISEISFLLKKTFNCPCCNKTFSSYCLKTGKVKQIGQDVDLRPHCADIDPLKYGIIMCTSCGYASLNDNFGKLTPNQIKLVKEKITPSFYNNGNSEAPLSYDDAIMRHKLALINAVQCHAKTSEKAYLFLLIGWLEREKLNDYRKSVLSQIKENANHVNDSVICDMENEVNMYLKQASEGLKKAYTDEAMPICGMDSNTVTYLIAALDYEIGEYNESLRWISDLISRGGVADRIKQRGRDLRDLVKIKLDDTSEQE